MRIKVLSSLLFLALLVANPAVPGAAQSGETPAAEEGPAASTTTEEEALEEFVPTEEVPADSAISFPVDI